MCVLGKNHLRPLLQSPIPEAHFSTSPLCLRPDFLPGHQRPCSSPSAPSAQGRSAFFLIAAQALSAQAVHSDKMPFLFPISNATNRSRPCTFHPLQSAGLFVSMLTSSIPEFLLPLGSGPSTWVQSLTVGVWNLPCAWEFLVLVNICISL